MDSTLIFNNQMPSSKLSHFFKRFICRTLFSLLLLFANFCQAGFSEAVKSKLQSISLNNENKRQWLIDNIPLIENHVRSNAPEGSNEGDFTLWAVRLVYEYLPSYANSTDELNQQGLINFIVHWMQEIRALLYPISQNISSPTIPQMAVVPVTEIQNILANFQILQAELDNSHSELRLTEQDRQHLRTILQRMQTELSNTQGALQLTQHERNNLVQHVAALTNRLQQRHRSMDRQRETAMPSQASTSTSHQTGQRVTVIPAAEAQHFIYNLNKQLEEQQFPPNAHPVALQALWSGPKNQRRRLF